MTLPIIDQYTAYGMLMFAVACVLIALWAIEDARRCIARAMDILDEAQAIRDEVQAALGVGGAE